MTTPSNTAEYFTYDEVNAFVTEAANAVFNLGICSNDLEPDDDGYGELIELIDACQQYDVNEQDVIARISYFIADDCVRFMTDNMADIRRVYAPGEAGHEYACARLQVTDSLPVGDDLDDVRDRLESKAAEDSHEWLSFWVSEKDGKASIGMEVLGGGVDYCRLFAPSVIVDGLLFSAYDFVNPPMVENAKTVVCGGSMHLLEWGYMGGSWRNVSALLGLARVNMLGVVR